jgi:leucyl-tRNA synthetase
MEYSNLLSKVQENGSIKNTVWAEAVKNLLLLLAPSAPHMTEELWQQLGYTYSIHNQSWPAWDRELAADEEITLVIQVNGKLRDKLSVPVDITEETARQLAFAQERIKSHIEGKIIAKIIYVPGRLLNIVLK